MQQTLTAAEGGVRAEQRSLADLAGNTPREEYLGASHAFLEAPLARAAGVLAAPAPARTRPHHEETP
jgi:hypothetical protein